MDTVLKICRVCRIEKPLIEFSKCHRYADGHLARCKECFKERQRRKVEELSKLPPPLEKKCPRCKEMLPLDRFCKSKSELTGRACWCKLCTNENGRKRYSVPQIAARIKDAGYQRLYGISVKEFKQIFLAQGMKCAICGDSSPEDRKKHWNVDHCHETGKVRGVLCRPCNFQLGIYENSSKIHLYTNIYETIPRTQ